MSKLTFARVSARFTVIFSALFAVLLTLSLTTNAFAIDTNPVKNGGFNVVNEKGQTRCSLENWEKRGQVKVVDGVAEGLIRSDSCVAKISRKENGVSSISQLITIPGLTEAGIQPPAFLKMLLWSKSENGDYPVINPVKGKGEAPFFPAQTITIYDANNKIIYDKGHNYNVADGQRGNFVLDLTGYAGQTVRLEIKVQLDHKDPLAPKWAELYVDQVELLTNPVSPVADNFAW